MNGLRQEKSAKLKYRLCTNLKKELKSKKFEDIKVVDLCKSVDISKVTFFKYFHCKEELLRYYFRVWCLEIGVELHHHPKNGLDGIRYIFEKAIKSIKERATFLPELISYQMRNDKIRAPFPISKIERELYHPKETELHLVEIKSLEQHLDTFTLEAILNNDISSSTPEQVTSQLHKFLLGNIIHIGLFKKIPGNIEIRQRIASFIDGYQR